MQIETFIGCIHTELDIIILIDLCQKNVLGRVTRRLHDTEKRFIKDGSIFVYEEKESGIKRWTDGKMWSPSRSNGIFLCYREYKPKGKFVVPETFEFYKKTITAKLKDKTYHIISYQNLENEINGRCCFIYGNRLKMVYEEYNGLKNNKIVEWKMKLKEQNLKKCDFWNDGIECNKNYADTASKNDILYNNEEYTEKDINNKAMIQCDDKQNCKKIDCLHDHTNLYGYDKENDEINFDSVTDKCNDIFENENNFSYEKNIQNIKPNTVDEDDTFLQSNFYCGSKRNDAVNKQKGDKTYEETSKTNNYKKNTYKNKKNDNTFTITESDFDCIETQINYCKYNDINNTGCYKPNQARNNNAYNEHKVMHSNVYNEQKVMHSNANVYNDEQETTNDECDEHKVTHNNAFVFNDEQEILNNNVFVFDDEDSLYLNNPYNSNFFLTINIKNDYKQS